MIKLFLSQMDQFLPIGPRAVGIYSQLFKYTLQVLQKTTMGPAPPKVHPVFSPQNNDGYSVLMVSFRAKYIYYSWYKYMTGDVQEYKVSV